MNFFRITKEVFEWIACVLVAFILALLIRFYVGTPTVVQMPSMFPTLEEGQRLILSRWSRTVEKLPSRGDIITFESPSNDSYIYANEFNANDVVAKFAKESDSAISNFIYYVLEINKKSYIKRVIALPGEHIQIQNGKVYINGVELQEDYLQPNITTDTKDCPYYDLIVPENCVFVMGDNRPKSTDSRRFGCIPLEKIESIVWIRFWPLNLFGKIDK